MSSQQTDTGRCCPLGCCANALLCIALLLCISTACDRVTTKSDNTTDDADSEAQEADESGSEAQDSDDTGSEASDTGDTESTEHACATPIDDTDDTYLGITPWPRTVREFTTGSEIPIQVGRLQCCVWIETLTTCSVYSIHPENQGVTIDRETGLMVIDESTPDGSWFTVTANVENGRFIVEEDIFVYEEALHPLKGIWYYTSNLGPNCSIGASADDDVMIIFAASGEYLYAVNPFERHIDGSAKYQTDVETGKITLFSDDGTKEIAEGNFYFDGDDLVLQGIGMVRGRLVAAYSDCDGIVFERYE